MDSEDQHQPQTNSKLWLSIGAVIVLTGIAIWLIPSKEPEPTPEIPLPTAPAKPATPDIQQPKTQRPQTESQPVQVSEQEGDKARQTITRHQQQGGSLDNLYSEAVELNDQGALADAYLLFFYAARNGHPDAALALGKQSDPTLFSAGTSIQEQPDLVQAYKWYRAAADKGSTEAEMLLEGLKLTVSDRATNGDPVAEGLLLQWQ